MQPTAPAPIAPDGPAEWWADGGYALRERAYAPVHDRLVQRLNPQRGERILDLACGLGAVAARVVRAGAEVTAVDIAPGLIEQARRRPEPVDWRVADCSALPFADDSFDAVASSFGVIFAHDPHRAAAELARVCRGRVALTAWMADPGRDLWEACAEVQPPAREWSSEVEVARLLTDFHLTTEEGVWWQRGASGEALWEWRVRSSPITRARLRSLSERKAAEVRAAWIERYEQFRVDGQVLVPQMYLLTSGHRR